MKLLHKAFKYRIFPNKVQQELINKTIGCSRFIYNHFLYAAKNAKYESYSKYNLQLTTLKVEYKFLKEVDSTALQNSLRELDDAFKRFFKKQNRFPKFKRKRKSRKSYTSQALHDQDYCNIQVSEGLIKLPKLGNVKAKVHRLLSGKILKATISRTPTNKYFVSLTVDCEDVKKLPANNNINGFDLGLSNYLIGSNNLIVANPKSYRKAEKALIRAQRSYSRKVKDSKNQEEARMKLAKMHEKVANIRKDFLHKLSFQIVNENQVIIMESLKTKNMLKNCRLAKSISDASWGTFLTYVEYKSNWYGRIFHQLDTFFPSSQMCSECGYQNSDLKNLKIRDWVCPNCGATHNRDSNAAKNIKQQGMIELKLAA